MATATSEVRATDDPARAAGTKIAIIGAGGVVFPLRLMGDMLTFPSLRGATYALIDLDIERASRTAIVARDLASHYEFPAVIEATDDQRGFGRRRLRRDRDLHGRRAQRLSPRHGDSAQVWCRSTNRRYART